MNDAQLYVAEKYRHVWVIFPLNASSMRERETVAAVGPASQWHQGLSVSLDPQHFSSILCR